MGVYLYCVAAPDHPDPGPLMGIDGEPVQVVDVAGLRGLLSVLDSAPAASIERVRRHNAVVESAAAAATPLPMRFGQWFESEAELAATLESRRPALERGLARVRGAVEFGVRVSDPAQRPEDPPPDRSSGRAYLEALARRERGREADRRRGEAVAAEMEEHLGSAIRAQSIRLLPGGAALLAAAHLVARHDTGTYASEMIKYEEIRPDLQFGRSGPWPPYGFVDAG